METSKKQANKIITIVVSMIFILGFGIDLYAPSFPELVKAFKTTEQLIQLSISTYFLGYIAGLMILGPLSDTIGRKKVAIYGLITYIIFSYLCSLSTNIYTFLALRCLQGASVASVGIVFRSMFSDIFDGKKLATAMTYASMSYRIGPIIAPLIGGYLVVYFGWKSNFYFLSLYSTIILTLVILFLPETHFENHPFNLKAVLAKYFSILKNRSFLGGAICQGTLYGMMIVFNVIGPFFIQDVLGYSPIAFGRIAFFMGVLAFAGILSNRILLRKKEVEQLIRVGIYSTLALCILQAILALFFPLDLYVFIIPVGLTFFASGLVVSNMMSKGLEAIPTGKGTAGALFGILLITATMILTALSSFLRSDTITPFAFGYLGMALLAFSIYKILFLQKTET